MHARNSLRAVLSSRWRPRNLRRLLWRPVWGTCAAPFARLRKQDAVNSAIVRLFYALNFYIWVERIRLLPFVPAPSLVIRPAWPIFWVNLENSEAWSVRILFFCAISAFLGLARPSSRLLRMLVFAGLLLETAILNSDIAGWERMGTNAYCYTLIAFLFIFLPESGKSRRDAWEKSLLVYLAQVSIIAGYFSSAIWRLREFFVQISSGMPLEDGIFGPRAFLFYMHFYSRDGDAMKVNGVVGVAGAWLTDHPLIAAAIMPLGTAFEIAGLIILFQPRLFRLFGLAAALFFMLLALFMSLPFVEHFLLTMLFLCAATASCPEPEVSRRES